MALAVIALFVGGEIAFRAWYLGLHAVTCPTCYTPRPIPSGRWTVPDPNPKIRYRLRPNMDTWFKGAPLRTNSLGFRAPEPADGTNGSHPRVVVLGRSISMGAGVAEDLVYPSLLDRWLRESELEGTVLNLSVGGYTFVQVAENYRLVAERIRPDAVILPVTLADVDATVDAVPPVFVDRGFQWLELREYLGDSFLYRVIREQSRVVLQGMGLNHDWRWRKKASASGGLPEGELRSLDVLAEFVTRLQREGIATIVVNLRRVSEDPPETQLDGVERLKQWADGLHGVKFVDTAFPLQGMVLSRDAIYPGDPHPTAKVHCFYAAVLFPTLVSTLAGDDVEPAPADLCLRCGDYLDR